MDIVDDGARSVPFEHRNTFPALRANPPEMPGNADPSTSPKPQVSQKWPVAVRDAQDTRDVKTLSLARSKLPDALDALGASQH
jgi:hypothetical protein